MTARIPPITNSGLDLRDYQLKFKSDVFQAWLDGHVDVCGVMPTGSGKCLARGTPVMRHDGSVTPVEDIGIGDMLMGPDSSPREVVSLARGSEMMYRVTPVKGEPYVVNESHILSLKMTGFDGGCKTASGRRVISGEVVNIPVLEYLTSSKTFKHRAKGWRVGVEYPEQFTHGMLPPYLLGLWLGDGVALQPEIAVPDVEIITYLHEFAGQHGLRVSVRDEDRCPIHRICGTTSKQNPFWRTLRQIGLIGNKHIPHNYLFNSREKRLQLLAGLLDTDGYLQNNYYEIACKDIDMAEQILRLARSLGLAAYSARRNKTCCNNGVVGEYSIITISGELDEIPCRVERKQAAKRRQKKSVLMTGVTVEPIGVDEYFGFELRGPDSLFLLGDFTVTHNTRVSASIVHEFSNAGIPTMIAAHRQELVAQLSLAMASEGIYHNIIASRSTIRFVSNRHVEKLGRSYYHPEAPACVSSVPTLIRRDLGAAADLYGLYLTDEFHHCAVGAKGTPNQWMAARQKFRKALGLGVTATPDRADGKGLGRHADGVADVIVEGPNSRYMIRNGFLTDYRIFCPPNAIDLSGVEITSGGDYSQEQLRTASAKSTIVGDVVSHYLRLAHGKRGVTFCVSIDDAEDIAAQFNAAGVPAVALSGKDTDQKRAEAFDMFERGELLQVVSVDLISEGLDIPAIEVISMARPTNSYSLYIQQIGRALRPIPGKTHAIIIDHVSNISRFVQKGRGLPDTPQQWSLDRRERGARTVQPADVMQLTTCLECFAAYDSHLSACPWCGAVPVVGEGGRSGPERVDGELHEMDPRLMAQLRGEADRILAPDYPEQVRLDMLAKHAPSVGVHTAVKRAGMQQVAQSELRGRMARWMSVWERAGLPVADVRGMFKQVFGVDYLTAQTLPAKGAEELAGRLDASLREYGA